jgi:hypothetical protein
MYLAITSLFGIYYFLIPARPAFFAIEYRRTESVCYYAIKSPLTIFI